MKGVKSQRQHQFAFKNLLKRANYLNERSTTNGAAEVESLLKAFRPGFFFVISKLDSTLVYAEGWCDSAKQSRCVSFYSCVGVEVARVL